MKIKVLLAIILMLLIHNVHCNENIKNDLPKQKYLVFVEIRVDRIESLEEALELAEQEIEFCAQKVKEGVYECDYCMLGNKGMMIISASSHEEVLDILLESPIYHLYDFKIEALIDPQVALPRIVARYKKLIVSQ